MNQAVTTDAASPAVGSALESEADVVIVGGGIIGAASAYFLASEGLKTVLVEKGAIGYEQSTRNWGWVHQQVRYPHLIPLAMRSVEIWQALDDMLGSPVEFVQGGNFSLAFDNGELALHEEIAADAVSAGLDARVVGREEIAARVPAMAPIGVGGLVVDSDGQANPDLVTAAFARAAREAGAIVYTHCAALGTDVQGGEVAGVETENGLIRTSRVVCAGGAWAARFARRVGADFPQRSVRSTVVRTTPVPHVTDATALGQRRHLSPGSGGAIRARWRGRRDLRGRPRTAARP